MSDHFDRTALKGFLLGPFLAVGPRDGHRSVDVRSREDMKKRLVLSGAVDVDDEENACQQTYPLKKERRHRSARDFRSILPATIDIDGDIYTFSKLIIHIEMLAEENGRRRVVVFSSFLYANEDG